MATPKATSEYFSFINANPKNRKTGDCVVRSLSFALGLSWEDTLKALTEIALKVKYMPNDKEVFSKLLEANGFLMYKAPKDDKGKRISLNNFIEINKGGMFVVSVHRHLTLVDNGMFYDSWDCSKYKVGNYWKRPLA